MGLKEPVARVFQLTVFLAISCVLGLLFGLALFYKVIRKGFGILRAKPRSVPPPILLDKKWGTHHYIMLKKQGLKLHYVEKGDQNNPLMLCLHGFPEGWFSWRHQLEEFSSQYRVVAIDMRGYGDSDKPSSILSYDFYDLVDDIKEFVEELGQSNCVLLAHDWGGIIAWVLVSKYPHLFNRHISINGPHRGVYTRVVRSNWDQLKKSWYVFFFQNWYLPELFVKMDDYGILYRHFRGPNNLVEAFPDDVIEAYKYFAAKAGDLQYPINYYRKNFLKPPIKENSVIIKVPTLIIWGTEDFRLVKELAKEMTKMCSDVQLKLVEGAGHFVHEEVPSHVNGLIWDYLRITSTD